MIGRFKGIAIGAALLGRRARRGVRRGLRAVSARDSFSRNWPARAFAWVVLRLIVLAAAFWMGA
jgi:hypothetical protein